VRVDVDERLAERIRRKWRVLWSLQMPASIVSSPRVWIAGILGRVTMFMGGVFEVVQRYAPGRSPELADFFAAEAS
jgi:VanZ family protein